MLGALLEVSSKEVSMPDYDGFTPLHYAAHNGQEGALEMLLQGEDGDKMGWQHRLNDLGCSVVLFGPKGCFPAPHSLVQRRLRIKTKQDATLSCRGGAANSNFKQALFQFICHMA